MTETLNGTDTVFTPSRFWGYPLKPALIVMAAFVILTDALVLIVEPSLWWVLLITTPSLIIVVTFVYLMYFKGERLTVTTDALVHSVRGKTTRYAFEDIQDMHFSENLYFGTVPAQGIAFTAKNVRGGIHFTNFNYSVEDLKAVAALVPEQYHRKPQQ